MNGYIVAFISAVIISFIMTPPARKLAIKVGALDVPKDPRKIHSKPMPYFGGLAIYISIMACMFVYMPRNATNLHIMAGATLIVLTGIVDDMYDMPAKIKMLMQVIAAMVAIKGGVQIHFITNPLSETGMSYLLTWLSYPVTLFWLVGITNTINLIDGLDGLASGVASIAATTLLFTAANMGHDFIVMQCAIIAGASLGFLPFNFNPAKIFMGDTGALLLGYMLAVTSVSGMVKSVAAVALAVPIFALGLPIFDTTFAIIRRYLNNKPIMQADKDHLHHKLMKSGLNQRQTVLIMYFISMMLGIVSIAIADTEPFVGIIVATIVVVAVFYFAKIGGLFTRKEQ
ncbi:MULTISPECIES: MraY family glycosyltransferase [unclassified Sedimentibacter]|uniref:MraY family glycosyltransferase n=1 Tax=unclassified Sedimentibacter TaxID=2649220 RepID=UPI001BD4A4F5|nr:MraY family glycosyltransferase [Sedimentibacter sp. MB35-C1]WMJ78142.1 undecaprenyl/decaprenyl-phosphate alpha-N-acetylglucosaminyl 1-phosphate transferase [Sedimentibacter sp. MB35-C1]